jgi:hypothetical protein
MRAISGISDQGSGGKMRTVLAMLLICAGTCLAQELAYNEQAEFDKDGNIFVSSDGGKLILMGNIARCVEASVADDRQTVICLARNPTAENSMQSLQAEIYFKGGQKRVIEPGASIWEWHFLEDGKQLALFFGARGSRGTHALYDTATGALVENTEQPEDVSQLPRWAKSALQIQNESVPMSTEEMQERSKWLTKVLTEVGKIHPGMTRKDLQSIFRGEGGLSSRLHRTYVLAECPYIKVDVVFRAAKNEVGFTERPEDVIESISRPYLALSVMD